MTFVTKIHKNGHQIPLLEGDAKKAVDHRVGHLQIIASAGSGKTETVAQRVASLVTEGVEPSSIVAFTFTERAAEELKSRIRARVVHFAGVDVADRLGPMYVGTIHGFCYQLLTTYVGRFESFDVIDENQLAAFVQRQSSFLKVKELDVSNTLFKGINIFRENLEVIENEMLDIELMPENLKFSVKKFYEMLDEYHLLTFGQQIARAVEALTDSDTHAKVTGDIKHLIVDEYQDVNPAQERLIQLLAKPLGNADLVVVGDDDQAIYQWRGSTVENITTFAQRYKKVTQYSLLENRRSRPQIVNAADHFANSISNRLDKKMKPSRENNGPALDIVSDYDTEAKEASQLAESIKKLVENGYKYSQIAILVRGRVAYKEILKAFELHDIPVQPGGRTGLFEQPDADFLGRCFAWFVDFDWKKGRFNTTTEKVTIDDLELLAKNIYILNENKWSQLKKLLGEIKSKVGNDSRNISLVNETYEILKALGVAEWDSSDFIVGSRLGTIARFQKFVADYESIQKRSRQSPDQAEVQIGAGDQGNYYFFNFASLMLNVAINNYLDFEGEENLLSDSVELTTVHSAKGLEWDIVFLPSLTKRRFPSSNSGKSKDWLVPTNLFDRTRYEGTDADERRLFYVAMTRAREWLALSAHLKVNVQNAPVSPYILEVQSKYKGELSYPKPWTQNTKNVDEQDLHITYSELSAYLDCGYSYWLRNLLGFPPAIVEEIGYGKAIHHLMRSIAEETKRTGKVLKPNDIERILATEFFLPYANKTIATRFKDSARSLVQTYLQEHSADMERVWEVERPFELALPGIVVSGRADVILDKHEGESESLAIVDYKTSIDERELGLQLQVYAAAGLREGLEVKGAFLHDLEESSRQNIDISESAIETALKTVSFAAKGIKERKFDAKPEQKVCSRCDVRLICKSAILK